MLSIMLKSKLHKLRVTGAEFEYEGSLGIDTDLMDMVKIRPYEKILVSNMANGNRFETYAIPAPAGSGTVALNGPACYQGKVGDRIVVFAFAAVPEEDLDAHKPLILVVDEKNRPINGLKKI